MISIRTVDSLFSSFSYAGTTVECIGTNHVIEEHVLLLPDTELFQALPCKVSFKFPWGELLLSTLYSLLHSNPQNN